jgi:hypothetical protein
MSPALLFLTVCLPLRLALALTVKFYLNMLFPMGVLYLFIGLGMMLIYLFNLRPTGIEAGGRIWWNSIRPVHSVLYLGFAIMAIRGNDKSWLFLLADVILGAIAFSMKKYF